MKKIIVIGCPGSGKSTFSRELSLRTGLPLFHLDMMYWNADRTTVEKSVFLEKLQEVIGGDEWIIDGNYASTMELRMTACDTVIFLDLSPEICLDGVRQRRGKQRSDIPWTELEDDPEFMDFIRRFEGEQRPFIMRLLEKYEDKNVIIFTSREQADEWLCRLR